jgi:hypothetical protein
MAKQTIAWPALGCRDDRRRGRFHKLVATAVREVQVRSLLMDQR